MNTPSSAISPGSSAGTARRQSIRSEGGKDGEEHDVDNWMLVGEKLNAEERLSEDVKKVLVADITTSLRRLIDDISEDNWMFDRVDLGYSNAQQKR